MGPPETNENDRIVRRSFFEMHARRCSKLDLAKSHAVGARLRVAMAKYRRRDSVGLPKSARERFVCLVTGVESDGRDRDLRRQKPLSGPLEAQPAVHLERRFADHASKHAVKMKGRKCGGLGERRKVERVVEGSRDVDDRPLHRDFVERSGVCFHLTESSPPRGPCLTPLAIFVFAFGPSCRSSASHGVHGIHHPLPSLLVCGRGVGTLKPNLVKNGVR